MSNKVKSLTCAVLVLTGCTTELPSNVNMVGDLVSSVKYSHTPAVEFDKVKYCIALNIKNENVRLSRSSDAVIGGKYYSTGSYGHTDFAPGTVVNVDDFHRYIVVNGSTGFTYNLIGYALRFRLQVQTFPGREVKMLFDNITIAQLYTGNSANRGFYPVAVHWGLPYENALKAVEQVKNDLTSCLSQ